MNNENLTVHFKVKDFNAWRTSYNGHEKDRASAGITNGRVFRSPDDPNDVVILQDVAEKDCTGTVGNACVMSRRLHVPEEEAPAPPSPPTPAGATKAALII